MPIIDISNFPQFTAVNILADGGHIKQPVVIPNAVKVMLLWQLGDGKLVRNVLGGVVGSFTSATATVAEQIRAAMVAAPNFAPHLATIAPTASFVGIDLQDIRQASLPTFRSTGTAVPGTATGTELPNEVAVVVTLRTAKVGRQWRGRAYMPGYSTAAIGAGNTIAAGVVTTTNNFFFAVQAGMAAGGLSMGLLQPERAAYTSPKGTAHPHRDAHIEPITTWVVKDNHWDSQRRRGLK